MNNMINNKTNNESYCDDFYSYMNQYKINNYNDATHISMGIYKGIYNVPENKIAEFNIKYSKCIKYSIPSMLEVHKEYGPIIIDLDFNYYCSNDNTLRRYDYDIIINLLKIYNETIQRCLKIDKYENIYNGKK